MAPQEQPPENGSFMVTSQFFWFMKSILANSLTPSEILRAVDYLIGRLLTNQLAAGESGFLKRQDPRRWLLAAGGGPSKDARVRRFVRGIVT